jgi:hypothetical protein
MVKTLVGGRVLLLAACLGLAPLQGAAQEPAGVRPLLPADQVSLPDLLPPEARLLNDPTAIERFLGELDGAPPNWASVLGAALTGRDERLFALNQERNQRRAGRQALAEVVTFVWGGRLRAYDADRGGFSMVLGPRLIPTRWGVVRFKVDRLPLALVAVPAPALRETLLQRLASGEHIKIDVVVTGRLIPEESLIYDFSHADHGQGMILPVVQIERLDYLLSPRDKQP